MANESKVYFRYKNEDGTIMSCHICGKKLWDDCCVDNECVCIDISDYDSLENLINTLKQLKRQFQYERNTKET